MGPNESKNFSSLSRIKMNRNYFEFRYIIGKGGFGKVWKVIFKKNQKFYALKEMSKVKIIDKKSEKSIKNERDFLSKLHHPFIVNMIYAFQDYENLFLVLDLLTGGDLRYHICKQDFFTEQQTKFFIACVLHGLEYIHENNIIHRDIKPENLVLDENGYIRITDFGVAKIKEKDNSSETSGTPGYMAPEVLCAQNHSFPVDFFAIGVMGYEFMQDVRPYLGGSRKEIKQAVLQHQISITSEEIPEGWTGECADFINKLLMRKPNKRLGYNGGVKEIKSHKWFDNFNWTDLGNKVMPSPFIPKAANNYDRKYCEAIDKINQSTIERYQTYMIRDNFTHLFNSYTYYNEQEINNYLLETSNQRQQQSTISTLDNRATSTTLSNRDTNMIFKLSSIKKKPALMLNNNLQKSSNMNPQSINHLSLRNRGESSSSQRDMMQQLSRNAGKMFPRTKLQRSASGIIENPSFASSLGAATGTAVISNSFKFSHEDQLNYLKNASNLSIFNNGLNTNRGVSHHSFTNKRLEGSQSCKAISYHLPALNGGLKIPLPVINNNNCNFRTFKPNNKKKKVIMSLSPKNVNILNVLSRNDSSIVPSGMTSFMQMKLLGKTKQ